DEDEVEVPTHWIYRQGIKVFPYAAGGGENGNLYAGTGSSITLGFEFLDIFGNVLEGVNLPQLVAPVRYTDRIKGVGQWPGITTGYLFDPDGANGKLTTTISFASEIYTNIPEDAERVTSALEAYLQIKEQLEGPGVTAVMKTTVAPSRAQDVKAMLLGFVDEVIDYLDAPTASPPPIARSLVMAGISGNDRSARADHALAVETTITIQRNKDWVDPEALTEMPEAHFSTTVIAPEATADVGVEGGGLNDTQPMALRDFAEKFEAAFP